MNQIKILFAILIASISHAQTVNGYHVTEDNHTVTGYFKETDFNNVNALYFSSSQSGPFTKLELDNVKEIGIGGEYKFQKHIVKIDDSDMNSNRTNYNKEGNWSKQSLFLNVIIEGDASLYSYNDSRGTRYFISVKSKSTDITQLIYRKYKSANNSIAENTEFRKQLYNNLQCNGFTVNMFTNVKYSKFEITNVVQRYNTCVNAQSKQYTNTVGKKLTVNYTAFAGVYNATFRVTNVEGGSDAEKGNNISYSLGGEIAFTVPSEKFTFFGKVEIEKLSVESVKHVNTYSSVISRTNTFSIDTYLAHAYLGARYNYDIAPKHRIYLDAAIGIVLPFSKDIDYTTTIYNNGSEVEKSTATWGGGTSDFYPQGGIGYTFNKKLGIDLRFDGNKSLFTAGKTSGVVGRIGLNLRYTFNR